MFSLYKFVQLNQYLTQRLISQASNKLIFQIIHLVLPLCRQHTHEVVGSYFTGECIVLNRFTNCVIVNMTRSNCNLLYYTFLCFTFVVSVIVVLCIP